MDRISQLQPPHYTANPTARAGGSEEALKKKSMDMPPPNAVDAPFKKKATALEGHPSKRHPSRRLQVLRVARPVAPVLRHPRGAGGALAS